MINRERTDNFSGITDWSYSNTSKINIKKFIKRKLFVFLDFSFEEHKKDSGCMCFIFLHQIPSFSWYSHLLLLFFQFTHLLLKPTKAIFNLLQLTFDIFILFIFVFGESAFKSSWFWYIFIFGERFTRNICFENSLYPTFRCFLYSFLFRNRFAFHLRITRFSISIIFLGIQRLSTDQLRSKILSWSNGSYIEYFVWIMLLILILVVGVVLFQIYLQDRYIKYHYFLVYLTLLYFFYFEYLKQDRMHLFLWCGRGGF